jgi:hypothetical protein
MPTLMTIALTSAPAAIHHGTTRPESAFLVVDCVEEEALQDRLSDRSEVERAGSCSFEGLTDAEGVSRDDAQRHRRRAMQGDEHGRRGVDRPNS